MKGLGFCAHFLSSPQNFMWALFSPGCRTGRLVPPLWVHDTRLLEPASGHHPGIDFRLGLSWGGGTDTLAGMQMSVNVTVSKGSKFFQGLNGGLRGFYFRHPSFCLIFFLYRTTPFQYIGSLSYISSLSSLNCHPYIKITLKKVAI